MVYVHKYRVFGYVNAVADRQISSEFPCRSVVLEGNYHALYVETATGNGSMVLIGSVQGAVIRANDCGGGSSCHNCAVVTTGTDASIWGEVFTCTSPYDRAILDLARPTNYLLVLLAAEFTGLFSRP